MHLYPELPYTKFRFFFIYYIFFLLDIATCYNNIMDFLIIYAQYIYPLNKVGIFSRYKLANILRNSFLNVKPDRVLLVKCIHYNHHMGQLNNNGQFGRIVQY